MAHGKIDLSGLVFGRLTVKRDSEKRSHRGDVIWVCECVCGNETEVNRGNLKSGNVASCGCLAREKTAERRRAAKVELPKCSIEGCEKQAREFDRTLCGMHAKRLRVYGDIDFKTPENVRSERQRNSILNRYPDVKKTTYRKLHGRHEHRAIGERIAGRKLKSDEHVHHIDGNRHNNNPSNLMVLSAEDHARLHARERSND